MSVPATLSVSFLLIVLVASGAAIFALGRAYAIEFDLGRGKRVAAIAAAVAALWMTGHALIAESGVLLGGPPIPPRMGPYFAVTIAVCVAFAMSRAGRMLATHTPLFALVGFHSFRVPLEMWLHAMYGEGLVPVQMTWSGWNFDVLTGVSAILVAVLAWKGHAPRALIWAWNILGSALLLIVIVIAFASAPTAMRMFTEGPSLDLALHAPYNWIATVLVSGALVGHVILARRLLMEDA